MENSATSFRKLASIQIVQDIKTHTNADSLALAQILGWQVVIKKEEVKVGQKVIYFEIDSLLPEQPWSEFMKPHKYKIKTIKLRKEISQGLILPLTILSENVNEDDFSEGQDVTELIGVTKYENDSDLAHISNQLNLKVSSFPLDFIEKSDEPRIQSLPKLLESFMNKAYVATLKYDGTSSTYLVNPNDQEDFWICSRNLRRDYDVTDAYSIIADKYKIKEKLISESCRFALQGEIYGPKISKNYLNVKDLKLAIFNAKDLIEGRYLDFNELESLCIRLELPLVDIVDRAHSFNYSVDDLKNICKGFYPNTKNPREGLVFRLTSNWNDKSKRSSFKIINDDFLIKHEGK